MVFNAVKCFQIIRTFFHCNSKFWIYKQFWILALKILKPEATFVTCTLEKCDILYLPYSSFMHTWLFSHESNFKCAFWIWIWIVQFELSFEWRYFGPCVHKITSRCVIWIAQFKLRSGPSFELRNSNYALWCNFAYTWSKIPSFEWSFKFKLHTFALVWNRHSYLFYKVAKYQRMSIPTSCYLGKKSILFIFERSIDNWYTCTVVLHKFVESKPVYNTRTWKMSHT